MKIKHLTIFFVILLLLSARSAAGGAYAQGGDSARQASAAGLTSTDEEDVVSLQAVDDGRLSAPPSGVRAPATSQTTDRGRMQGSDAAIAGTAVAGPQKWVTLMCKFPDVPVEPRDLVFFQNMYGSAYPGLDHYFQEASYGQMTLAGSSAHGWFTLPQPFSYYDSLIPQGAANTLLTGCINAADPTVDFSTVVGVNLVFNATLDIGLFIGRVTMTLDGVRITRFSTLQFPEHYQDLATTAKVMAAALGMQPTLERYDPELNWYFLQANIWDVVSVPLLNCPTSQHPIYGCVPHHPDSVNRDYMGWIPSNRLFVSPTGTHTITLEQLTQPPAGNYLMAKVPIDVVDWKYYTIEARRPVGYDAKLPGSAVIIRRVNQDSNLFDGFLSEGPVMDADGNGNVADAGAMWTVGETFTDAINGVSISIDSATATGFVVTITRAERGRIFIEKETSPSNAPESFTFSSSYAGEFQLEDDHRHNSGPIPSGTYSVSEINLPANWTQVSATCSDGSDPSAINLSSWETVTCTFTNRKPAGYITVWKETVPTGSTEQFTFTSSYDGEFQLSHGFGHGSGWLLPGTYSVSETDLPPGWTLSSATCSDGSDPAAINLADGEAISCTFVNNGPVGHIRVVNQTTPYSNNLFQYDSDYAGVFYLGSGQTHNSGILPPGTYSVAATSIPAGYTLTGATCDDGSDPQAIDLDNGETVTCTFTNHKPEGTILVDKVTIPSGATETFFFTSDFMGDFELEDGSGGGHGGLTPGVYSVSEIDIPNGWTLTSATCDDGSDPSAINLADGEVVSCTFTNSRAGVIPTAAFTASPLSGPAPLVVNFTDQSTGSPTSWAWTFGDGGTSTQRNPSRTYTTPGTYTVSLTATNAQGSDGESKTGYITVTAPPASPSLYVSPMAGGTVGGIATTVADILYRDGAAATWSMHFDGSDVSITKALTAFARLPNGDLLLVFKANQVTPAGTFTPWDVARFTPTSLGSTTAGTFSWYIDGSDVGLTTSAEKIDALDVLSDGRVVVSTAGTLAASKTGGGTLKSQDEDLSVLNHTSLGATTAGTWALYFDGTLVTGLKAEDVAGAHVDEATGDLYLTILGTFKVGGVAGNGKDVMLLTPSGGGYTVSHFWRGPLNGFNLNLNGMELSD